MKEIIVASTNQGKIKEIRAMLEDIGIKVTSIKDVLGYNPDIEETGQSFIENAVIKAESVMKMIDQIVLADDSGLVVDALDGAPGIYSSRWMGEETSYDIKNQKLIELVNESGKARSARFICAMALAIPGEKTITIEESFEGEIYDHIEGENGFGYDPIFYYPPLHKTSADMSMEEKNQYSHRAKALKKLYAILKEK